MEYYAKYLKYNRMYHEHLFEQKHSRNVYNDNLSVIPINPTYRDINYDFTLNMFENFDSVSNLFSPIGMINSLVLIHIGAIQDTNNLLSHVIGAKFSIDDISRYSNLFNNQNLKSNTKIITKTSSLTPVYSILISEAETVQIVDSNNWFNPEVETSDPNSMTIITSTIVNLEIDPQTEYYFDVFDSVLDNKIRMMKQIKMFDYYEDSNAQLIEMPVNLDRNNVCKFGVFILKQDSCIDRTINRIPQITSKQLAEYVNNLSPQLLDLSIPIIKNINVTSMKNTLIKMGLENLFKQGVQLDSIAPGIYLNDIIDRTSIRMINSKSTDRELFKGKPIVVKANTPFIYYVRLASDNVFIAFGDYGSKN